MIRDKERETEIPAQRSVFRSIATFTERALVGRNEPFCCRVCAGTRLELFSQIMWDVAVVA